MTKKTSIVLKPLIFHFLKIITISALIGFLFGVTKTVLFESDNSGRYAVFSDCEEYDYGEDGRYCIADSRQVKPLAERAVSNGYSVLGNFVLIGLLIAGLTTYTLDNQNQLEISNSKQNTKQTKNPIRDKK